MVRRDNVSAIYAAASAITARQMRGYFRSCHFAVPKDALEVEDSMAAIAAFALLF
jgi:hypothetical protein